MSLFGSLMGDFEDDPFFGSPMQTMQRMNSMMNSMFADPFGMMGSPLALMDHPQNQQQQHRHPLMGGMQMMPFPFPPMPVMSMGRMSTGFDNMANNPNCHSFTSSSIMTMTSGPDGRPQIYQETSSTRAAPGGVKETKKTVSDSRTGTRKLAIGHHIGERAHILEREQNVHTGDQEEHQEYINLEEEEADTFNREWENKARRTMAAIGGPSPYRQHNPYSRSQQENKQLALPSTVPTSNRQQSRNHSRTVPSTPTAPLPRRAIRSALSSKSNKVPTSASTSRPAESTSTSPSAAHVVAAAATAVPATAVAPPPSSSSPSSSSRKRERSPDVQDYSNKRRSQD